MITWNEILNNRRTWAEYLMQPERKKAKGRLDAGNEARCCLGHACYVLGSVMTDISGYGISYDGERNSPTNLFAAKLGLRRRIGCILNDEENCFHFDGKNIVSLAESADPYFYDNQPRTRHGSLAELNDQTEATPQQIGAYLLTVLEGGDNTPFIDKETWEYQNDYME